MGRRSDGEGEEGGGDDGVGGEVIMVWVGDHYGNGGKTNTVMGKAKRQC